MTASRKYVAWLLREVKSIVWPDLVLRSVEQQPAPQNLKVGVVYVVQGGDRGGSRNLNSGDKWIADLTAAMLAAKRKQDEQATPPEPQSGIQGQGGAGCCEG